VGAIVSKAGNDNAHAGKSRLVVELAGPAGSGKTTLLQALSQRNRQIVIGAHPQGRQMRDLPFFIGNAILLVPTFLRLWQNGGRLTGSEAARMIRLKGWHRFLGRQATGRVVILDQGPVYTLATLRGFGPESLNSQGFQSWWDGMLRQWASILDMVIWLDAPDRVLAARINTRRKGHAVKGKSEQEALEFLEHYRTAYAEMLSALSTNSGGPRILVFDTSLESLDEIANGVLTACGLKDGEDEILQPNAGETATQEVLSEFRARS
jgi:thymidylate kinase